MGKSTISMAMFNSKLLNYQRVLQEMEHPAVMSYKIRHVRDTYFQEKNCADVSDTYSHSMSFPNSERSNSKIFGYDVILMKCLLVGGLKHEFIFPDIGNHHPN